MVGWNIEQEVTRTTRSSPSTSPSSSPSSSAPSSSSAPQATPAGSTESTGLSTGVAAGIGVGVALGVIGVVALLVVVYLQRRKKRKAGASEGVGNTGSGPPLGEGPKTPAIHELHQDSRRAELFAHHVTRPPAELYAG